MPNTSNILLQTKLHRPRVTRDFIARPQLLERLNRGLDGRLTLVCAAAGFGKTTLVSSWIDSLSAGNTTGTDRPAIWLSLDEKDSDLGIFVRYVVSALRTRYPDMGAEILELIQGVPAPPIPLLANLLCNAIDSLPGEFILVLDDYSAIRGQEVHDFLNALLLHWPRPLHLAMITRANPPLPLANLRARGQICEIRGKDLRFSYEDTSAYLNKVLPQPPTQTMIDLLAQQTEGWAAGLQLAALTLRSSEDPQAYLSNLAGADADIAGYLIAEVLDQQPPMIQNFLLKTSILDRFSAGLCQAVVGDQELGCDMDTCLEWVEQANLFVIPLDNHKGWYRYHHLFQDLLQHRMQIETSTEQVLNLHRKAAGWLAEQGLIEEAIHHALKAGDSNLAARLMEQGLRDVLNREDLPTLERWLRLLPGDLIHNRPGLMMIKAWVSNFKSQMGAQSQDLRRVEALLSAQAASDLDPDGEKVLRGQIDALYAQEAFFNNQIERCLASIYEAQALLPETWGYLRGRLTIYQGMALHTSGQGETAEQWLLEQYAGLKDLTGTQASNIQFALGFCQYQAGQFERAAYHFLAVLQRSPPEHLGILRNWARYFLGSVHYQKNELDAGQYFFGEVVLHRYTAHATTYRQALSGIALLHQLHHQASAAWDTFEALSQYDLEQLGRETPATGSLRARLWLMQGDLERACWWADAYQAPVPDEPLLWMEIPHLTKVRILLARGGSVDARLALSILERLAEIARQTNNPRRLGEILAMQALALEIQGKASAAQASLERAVRQASPGGNLRIFVDLGGRMQTMLTNLVRQGRLVSDTRPILAVFSREQASANSVPAYPAWPDSGAFGVPFLAEPLTPREYDILVLLRQRLSNKEIAQRLNISPATVKRHCVNLYGKLDVSRRWDAVAKAMALGILPAP